MSMQEKAAQMGKDVQSQMPDESSFWDKFGTFAKYGAVVAAIGVALTVLTFGGLLSLPVILLTAPLWIPALIFFVVSAGFLLSCAAGLYVAYIGAKWAYNTYKGQRTPEVDMTKERVKTVAGSAQEKIGGIFG